MNLREKISEVIEGDLHPIPDDKRDSTHKFYYKDYRDNLIYPMAVNHFNEYSVADGGELEAKGKKPAKMASITSSSAMTFNLLGNTSVAVKVGQDFAAGSYDIAYEKQLLTLNKGSNPANLDAFLSNPDAGEAIFCEMKMLEWIGPPGALKEAYLNRDYYFSPCAYDVFSKIAYALRKSEIPYAKNAYPSIFTQYDAWQMFKHTLAIYNATSETTKEALSRKTGSMAGKFKKITLANVVFEMDTTLVADEALRIKYAAALDREHQEADTFIQTMLSPENGLVKLFWEDCGVKFDIRYVPAHEFVAMFDKSNEELSYLKRYCCK